MPKMSSSLPTGDANGLTVLSRHLVERPHEFRCVIALVDCSKITTDTDTGDVVPTVRVQRIEAVPSEDIDMAERVMRRAMERRTGQTVLPLDMEDALRDAFANVDPETGEILPDPDKGAESPDP